METSAHMAWMLSIQKTKSNVLSNTVKAIVVEWWTKDTRPSPNRKEVVRKWISIGVYEEMHI